MQNPLFLEISSPYRCLRCPALRQRLPALIQEDSSLLYWSLSAPDFVLSRRRPLTEHFQTDRFPPVSLAVYCWLAVCFRLPALSPQQNSLLMYLRLLPVSQGSSLQWVYPRLLTASQEPAPLPVYPRLLTESREPAPLPVYPRLLTVSQGPVPLPMCLRLLTVSQGPVPQAQHLLPDNLCFRPEYPGSMHAPPLSRPSMGRKHILH